MALSHLVQGLYHPGDSAPGRTVQGLTLRVQR